MSTHAISYAAQSPAPSFSLEDAEAMNLNAIASAAGMFATLCFTLQYVPQCFLNARRQSCRGFSATGIIIKLVGASFLAANSAYLGESLPVILYGLFNVAQHSIFIVQFYLYSEDVLPATRTQATAPPGRPLGILAWLGFPVVPVGLAQIAPHTMSITSSIKPLAQVFSHVPQLAECVRMRSTSGCSLGTQHLNAAGGLAGLLMCYLRPPQSIFTTMLYVNSLGQALSLYYLYFLYDFRRSLVPASSPTKKQSM